MKEILFENRFIRDKSTAKEVYAYHFFKRPLMKVFYVISGIYALSGALGLILDFQNAKEMITPLLLIVFAVVMMIVAYNSQVKALVGRDAETAKGEDFFNELSVSEDEISITSPVGSQSIGLDKMKYAFVTRNYICVVTQARLMYIFKKDSFTVGNSDGFISFLRDKGIKIRGKKTN